jgi:NAD+ synthase
VTSPLAHHPLDIQPALVLELLVRFLREETSQTGHGRALLGLSGGIDSAVVAALCARAFGPENVLAVALPHRDSSADSEVHARLVAERLGLSLRRIDISPMVDGYATAVGLGDRARLGNLMARCRMIALYDLSVEWRGLVIGTSNKTEILLGYSTLWGDSAHAINPIGDLYKHQVYQLARHLDLPREVVEKSPSADLYPGQTDEGDLGFTYAEADVLLWHLVDRRRSEDELVALGFPRELIKRVSERIVKNQFKRLPPLICKLSQRTVNQDFRYLRDWGR